MIKSDFEEYVQYLRLHPEAAQPTAKEQAAATKEDVSKGGPTKDNSANTDHAAKSTAKTGCLKAAANGRILPMTEAKDEAFASCMMGNGYVVCPTDGVVVSPADGTVSMLMEDSFHAVGIQTGDGINLLIHIGIDTVTLKGEGFMPKTSAGQKVAAGDPLITFDKNLVESKGLCADIMVIVLMEPGIPEIEYLTGMEAEAGKTVVAKW